MGMAPTMIPKWARWLIRYLALVAFAFWQGGFVFYAGVVVPVGASVWGDRTQGFFTRLVTPWMNVAGLAACCIFILDALISRQRRKSRLIMTLVMALSVFFLFYLQSQINKHLDPDSESIANHPVFRWKHQVYLWLCTTNWLISLFWLGLTVSLTESTTNQINPEKQNGPQMKGIPDASAAQEA